MIVCHKTDCQEDCNRCQEDALDRQLTLSDITDYGEEEECTEDAAQ